MKSRAEENDILYNRLTGESDGTESYEINLPNAGTSYIIGNLIQQGPTTQNSAMLDYGSEGASNAGNDLYVVNNTFVNERTGGATFVSVSTGVAVAAVIKNNIFVGTGTVVSQASAVQAGNFASGNPMLVDSANFDYHLAPGSPCIDAGVDPGSATSGFSLVPHAQYIQPATFEGRQIVGKIDIGAYELNGGTGVADAGSPQGGSGSGGNGASGAQGGTGNIGENGFDAGASGAASASPTVGSCSCRVAHRKGFTGPLLALGVLLLLARRLRRINLLQVRRWTFRRSDGAIASVAILPSIRATLYAALSSLAIALPRGQLEHAILRFSSTRRVLASRRFLASSSGTTSPRPKYISSGVCPSNALCGITVLCSTT